MNRLENTYFEEMSSVHVLRRAALQLHALSRRMLSSERKLDPIVSTRHPNTFGTLGHEAARNRMVQLPDEKGDQEEVEFIDGIEGKTRLPLVKYARIIKKLLEKNQLREALDVLDVRMKTENVRPDKYIYNLLISGCADKGYTKKSFQLFNQMKKRGIYFSGSTYTSLLNACSKSPFPEDGIKRACHLRELMREKGHEPDERTYHAMIKAFGRCGDLELAFNVVDEMHDRRKIVSTDTYSFLLQACASDKEAGFRHALLVWRIMLTRKMRPTVYNYNLLLRCSRDCNVGDMDTLREDVKKMIPPSKSQKCLDDRSSSSFTALSIGHTNSEVSTIDSSNVRMPPNLLLPDPQLGSVVALDEVKFSWHRLALLGGSSGFLVAMKASGATPDIKTMTLLLETIEPTAAAEEELIQLMKTLKIKMDLDFCNLLIKKRAIYYRFDEAKKTVGLIRERSLTPNIVTFGVLALACTGFEDAKELIESLERQGYRANVEILGSLFQRASQSYDLKMMRFVLVKLKQEHLKPNKALLAHINRFQSRVEKHQNKMKDGSISRPSKLDSAAFLDSYEKLCGIFEKLKQSEIEGDENVNPWDQFRTPGVTKRLTG